MKKFLLIETFPETPHIETSVEIALNLKKSGNEVFFYWCGYDLPWTDWELPLYKKLLFFSYKRKIYRIINYLKKKDVSIVQKFNLTEIQNKYIDSVVNNFKNYSRIKYFKYKKIPLGLSVHSSLVSKFNDENIYHRKKEISSSLKSSCIVYERSRTIIKKINPDKVITFNSRFSISKPIIEAAQKQKKLFFIHERGANLNKYEIFNNDIFDYNYIFRRINQYWKKNNNKYLKIKIAKKYFTLIKKKKFFLNQGYDFEIKSSKKKFFLDKKKKIITFLCSTDYEYQSTHGNIKKFFLNKKWSNQINVIKSIINIIKNDKNIILYIKSHPNFSSNKIQENKLHKLQNDNVIYLPVNKKIDVINLIKNSDVIITFGTTLELYALFINKPVISFFKSFYYNFKLVIHPQNELHLKKLLNNRIKINKVDKFKLFRISYYLMIFGIKYKFYKPISFSKGYLKKKI
jgi:hypothetical protein